MKEKSRKAKKIKKIKKNLYPPETKFENTKRRKGEVFPSVRLLFLRGRACSPGPRPLEMPQILDAVCHFESNGCIKILVKNFYLVSV